MAGGDYTRQRRRAGDIRHLLQVDLAAAAEDDGPVLGLLAAERGGASHHHQQGRRMTPRVGDDMLTLFPQPQLNTALQLGMIGACMAHPLIYGGADWDAALQAAQLVAPPICNSFPDL